MMDSKQYTEEAIQVLESYISAVGKALQETDLTESEIEESLNDLRYHITAQCEIRSSSNIISTDLIKLSIKKLGDPKTIARSLQSELDFQTDMQERTSRIDPSTHTEPNTTSRIKITAGHLTAIYSTFSWLITSIWIFLLFGPTFSNWLWLFPMIFMLAVGSLFATRNLESYMYNRHLQQHIKPNIHTNITPLLFIASYLAGFILIPTRMIWTLPLTIIIWLILSTTEYGREFYLDIINEAKKLQQD